MNDASATASPAAAPALLAQIDRAGRAVGRRAAGVAVAEGWRLLERALLAGRRVPAVAVAASTLAAPGADEARALDAARAAGVALVAVDDAAIADRLAGRSFGAMLAVVEVDDAVWSGAAAAAIVARPREGGVANEAVVVLERVLDPGNVGTIARSAAALGYAGLVVVDGCCPMHAKALRTSMGALFTLPVGVWTGDGPSLAAALAAAGARNIATCLDGEPLSALLDAQRAAHAVPARRALWLGSEAHGLRPATRAACDVRVAVEMPGASALVDSLSVGAAAAIALWALRPVPSTASR